jgi:hypothetical protein
MTTTARSCASCDQLDCAMHRPGAFWSRESERTAWVLDDAWPETASMVTALFRAGDQLLAPAIFPGIPVRYRWPLARTVKAVPQTIARHWSMLRVSKAAGAIRQRSYMDHDRAIARQLARSIDYRARHLVVAQNWLPWLEKTGALGGRSFDVVMNRYPLAEIHRLLDTAAAELGPSETISDFRADPALVALETDLLGRARRIITPHHGIAALFPDQAMLLGWHQPDGVAQEAGTRVAFLGPTIGRQRPDIARALTHSIEEPLVVFGPILEPFWEGHRIEQRIMGPGWLEGIGSIIHPATMTHQPRKLLAAIASGVRIYATPECGLDTAAYRPLEDFRRRDLRRRD